MTKKIRVENADTSTYKVIVQTWNKSSNETEPDILTKEVELNYPADLSEFYIHTHQYIVIKENGYREE